MKGEVVIEVEYLAKACQQKNKIVVFFRIVGD
jgi:hypothetical protein